MAPGPRVAGIDPGTVSIDLCALDGGEVLLDESFSVYTAVGLVLILGGSWLAAGGELPTRRRDVAAAGDPHGGPDATLLEGGPERADRVAA